MLPLVRLEMRIVAILLAGVSAAACKQPASGPPAQQAIFQRPTASEVFVLRSKCAELAQKIMEENIVGSALTQSQVSHYDPKTNRCYVELTVLTADLAKSEYFARYLYDGQTGEILAWTQRKKGQKPASAVLLPNEAPSGNADLFDAASLVIDKFMADDRKQ